MSMLQIYMDRRRKIKTDYGIPFECVELARRFYNQYYGLTFPSIRDAYQMFKKIDSLIHTANHQVVQLQTIVAPNIDRICVGDALFWRRKEKNDNYGHVGIIVYSDGNQGWIGDNPYILLATDQIRSTGWSTSATIASSIVDTVNWLTENRWVFN